MPGQAQEYSGTAARAGAASCYHDDEPLNTGVAGKARFRAEERRSSVSIGCSLGDSFRLPTPTPKLDAACSSHWPSSFRTLSSDAVRSASWQADALSQIIQPL